jgi:hypothetical protein
MYYHRKPPGRSLRHYLTPFFIIVFLILLIFFVWRALNTMLIDSNRNTESGQVFLEIHKGSIKAMAEGSDEWQGVPDKIHLYQGEKIRTGGDGKASLTFFENSVIRLNENTELQFETLQKKKETHFIDISLKKGELWGNIEKINNPDSAFEIRTDLLTVKSRGGEIAVENPGTVHMVEGEAQITVMAEKEMLKTYTLGVGQQFMIDAEGITSLKNNEEVDVIFALSDTFKKSSWYQWNQGIDGELDEGALENENENVSEGESKNVEEDENSEEDPDTEEIQINEEGETTIDPSDKTPPEQPIITSPGKNGDTVTLKDVEQAIEGTVSADTAAVIVNDYRLQQYKPGSKTFVYRAKTSFGNLQVGENEYKVIAEDKNGNQSQVVTITLVLPQEVIDANQEEEESETTGSTDEEVITPTELPTSNSNGGVKITAPNDGESFSTTETEFSIEGIVPEETVKVVVNGYTLTQFKEGDISWTYRAYASMGSLEIGAKNSYNVKAFNAEGDIIGSASITIDVESDGAPEISIPTGQNSYTTTLNELVIGGSIGKWVTEVYVNGEKLFNYTPGSKKWHHTVKLNPGSNSFDVYGQKNEVKTANDSIEIIYQP